MKYLILLGLLISCNEGKTKEKIKDEMKCDVIVEKISYDIYRCENTEVICYQYRTGFQCKFKEKK